MIIRWPPTNSPDDAQIGISAALLQAAADERGNSCATRVVTPCSLPNSSGALVVSAVDDLLTGEKNLRLMTDLHHLGPAEGRRRIADLLERFELTDAAAKLVATYSGGMKRRLDLAMTLVGNPRIVFLDEPTAGLDPRGRRTMWQIVRGLVVEGITIFLTTQYLEEADDLAGRIALRQLDLDERLEQAGPRIDARCLVGARRMARAADQAIRRHAAIADRLQQVSRGPRPSSQLWRLPPDMAPPHRPVGCSHRGVCQPLGRSRTDGRR